MGGIGSGTEQKGESDYRPPRDTKKKKKKKKRTKKHNPKTQKKTNKKKKAKKNPPTTFEVGGGGDLREKTGRRPDQRVMCKNLSPSLNRFVRESE